MTLDHRLRKVASALYAALDTPRSLTCFLLMSAGEWDQLATLAIDPHNYPDSSIGAERYRRDAQATDFLRKSPLLPTSVDKREKAVQAFWDSEKQCFQTNQMLQLLRYPSIGESPMDGALRRILRRARKIARNVLGPIPDHLDGAFGPGTSFELKGAPYSTLADKMWITPHATSACMPLFEHMLWPTLWGRTRISQVLPLPTVCRGNRFTTVPKDSTKDRGICVEPLGNLFVQLGIGRHLKRRLSLHGIQVNRVSVPTDPVKWLTDVAPEDGQTIHQRLAREGSATGRLATIDLSNASDTVAFELVREVIPPDWFELLCAARSPMTMLDGQWVHLDKFSSMGNGFTFELETLLFASILEAATGARMGVDLHVYGDDIILPRECGSTAMAILRSVGFSPNMRKSFLSGPFRESCGGDFFVGVPVRPYQSTGTLGSPLEWVAMHNQLKRRWPQATLALKRCVDAIPLRLRCYGPPMLEDRVLHGPYLARSWVQNQVRWVATIKPVARKIPLDRWGEEFIFALLCLGVPSEGITPRRPEVAYRLSKASVS